MTHHCPRILIVEDEPELASLLGEFLTDDAEFEVTVTEDGLTAATALAGADFDLAVIDLLIPQGSGLDIASRAMAQNVPVLLTSGDLAAAAAAAELGLAFLEKPFRLDDLLRKVRANIAMSKDNIQVSQACRARCADTMHPLKELMQKIKNTR